MSNTNSIESKGKENLTEKYGCLIYIIATIFFAIQRYLLFSFLLFLSSQNNSTASSSLEFLFGVPPYSFFDVLLGVEIPDEGLLLLLQPRIWTLGLVQAIHFGLNFGLAMLPLWLKSKIDKLSGVRKWLGYSGCIGLFIIPIFIFLSLGFFSTKTNVISSETKPSDSYDRTQNTHYSSSEYGIHFDYPDFLSLEDEMMKDRGSGGEIITMITISATGADPFVGVIIRSIEDPLRNEMFPNSYPPDETIFQLLIMGDLKNLDYDDTEENKNAIYSASENIILRSISNHDAAEYSVGLSSSEFGHIYMRGALVITERRDISIFVIGSDEPEVHGSVTTEVIDSIWADMIESLVIDF